MKVKVLRVIVGIGIGNGNGVDVAAGVVVGCDAAAAGHSLSVAGDALI